MKQTTVATVPLWTIDGAAFISDHIRRCGVQTPTIRNWLEVCHRLRQWALAHGLVYRWPVCCLYARPEEAAHDQIAPAWRRDLEPEVATARGWSVFGAAHDRCRPAWSRTDRSILHANHLGGPMPIGSCLLHELAHHHLHQVRGASYPQQLSPLIEKEVTRLAYHWIRHAPPELAEHDTAAFRLLDLLTSAEGARAPGPAAAQGELAPPAV